MRRIWERIVNMSLGGKLGFLALLAGAGLVAFVVVARAVNTHPAQCATCHPEMTALWKASLAHPAGRATCHECHAAHAELPATANLPGYVRDLFIPEKYMASAERIEGRCLGCHAEVPGADKEKGKRIKVNHKVHLAPTLAVEGEPAKLVCLDCHGSVAHDKTSQPTNRPQMQGCFAGKCHAKERNKDSCLVCHHQMLVDRPPETAAR